MGRLFRPESKAPDEEEVDPVTYGRIYVGVVTGDAAAEPEESEAVVVTEPDAGDPPAGAVTVEEPRGNASTEEWTAFAIQAGAAPEDLVDDDGEPLGRDALRDKFATPSE